MFLVWVLKKKIRKQKRCAWVVVYKGEVVGQSVKATDLGVWPDKGDIYGPKIWI